MTPHLHTHILEQLNQVVHIQNIRNVLNAHSITRQQCRTNHFQRFILSTLRNNLTTQTMTALYNKRLHCHDNYFFLLRRSEPSRSFDLPT